MREESREVLAAGVCVLYLSAARTVRARTARAEGKSGG